MVKSNKSQFVVVKQFLAYLKPYKKGLITAWFLLVINILMQLPMPLLTMYIVDNVLVSKDINLLNTLCIGLFFFLLVQLSVAFLQRKIIINIQNRVITTIRINVYEKIVNSTLKFFDQTNAGDLITRITSDVSKLQALFADTIVSFFNDGLTLIVGLVVLFFLHWKLALISLAIIPLYLLSLKYFNSRLKDSNTHLQQDLSILTSALFESFLGAYFVKSFGTEKEEIKRTGVALDRLYNSKKRSELLGELVGIITGYITAIGRFVLIWYGFSEVIHGRLTIGAFLAFNSFLRYIYDPSKNLMNMNATVQGSIASLERVDHLIHQAEKYREPDGKIPLTDIKGKVTFKDVNFTYDSQRGKVLRNLNFSVEPNSVVAIVGPNGAGKTTLINLLLRLYQPDSGTIEIDDVDISSVQGESMRSQIGFVPQDIYLLSHTIGYNIAYGSNVTSADAVIGAAKSAKADEFIKKLPKGYHTVVGERGGRYNFSGGEKQRLSIARAFLKPSKILIFDEATSSIDNESSHLIQQAMKELIKGKTAFIIAHQLATVVNSDLILVMDEGEIVQRGTHKELVQQDGLYKNLFEKEMVN